VELGTFEYPYKKLIPVFIELMNFYANEPTYSAQVFLKEETIHILYSIYEPILIVSSNLTFTPYSSLNQPS
jgi:hypothetical protein